MFPKYLLRFGFPVGKFSRSFKNTVGISSFSRGFSAKAYDPKKVINCAIIAHVDHGKTTMMDKLLKYCGTSVTAERAMDSNVHEKERGITIMSKYTRLHYKDHTLHVVDTPGHADFGGEVERILSMVDGVVLLVDAAEGPMSQTKFVLSKALGLNRKAIVVLNKIDRDGHRATQVESEILDLFCALTTNEELLEFPLLYASGRNGWVVDSIDKINDSHKDVGTLVDMIIKTFKPASDESKLKQPFRLSVNTLQSDYHLGRIVTGKVETGVVNVGDRIKVLDREGNVMKPAGGSQDMKVTKMFYLEGLDRVEVQTAHAGEIVSLAGSIGGVGDTVCSPENTAPLPTIPITPPLIAMTFSPNDSPFHGREGSKFTSSLIKQRLNHEVENNVTLTLRPTKESSESVDVLGRGELQLGILIESLRREGFELTVSPPKVIPQIGEDGTVKEPIEEVTVDIDNDISGKVIDMVSLRKGRLIEYKDIGNRARLIFHVPSRGLMGFRYEALNSTRGNATINCGFSHYDVVDPKEFNDLKKSKLVSCDSGKTTAYALDYVQERGQLFVGPGEEVYSGMVVGENSHSRGDLEVNPIKSKKLTNVRNVMAEDAIRLQNPKRMTIEEVIAYMDEDEVLEVTPKSIRLRKRVLDASQRARMTKASKK